MTTKDHLTKKTCAFYASEYHLEMILLPYIKQNLKDAEIILFTENDLEKTLNILLEKTNLKETDKEKIKQINWKKDDKTKWIQLKECQQKNKKCIAIINGNEKYIWKIDSKIKQKNTKIIHCFNISNTPNAEEIQKKYNKILNTNLIK